MFRKPELLAPAGGFEQLKAAVENGADAVYMGGKLFNARINADNFNDDAIESAIDYAHMKGVKLYVTMNTLVKDSEMREALTYAVRLYEAGADALIIQDLGLAKTIKKIMPDLPLHLSTQGTVFNVGGVRAAKALGFKRVVLARELTLEEIKEIIDENLMEIEVFAHGALCICYSGQCQLSWEIGGRSGNRGLCAQPCRLPYSIYSEVAGKRKLLSRPGYLLSPKDLNTIEHIDKLAEAGIASLKIEGRMKSPEYTATVTRIYRKYLDAYSQSGRCGVSPSDLADLEQIFNRGGFTSGYLFGNPGKDLMSGDLPKHQGTYLGKILQVIPTKKKSDHQTGLIMVKLEKDLAVGDRVEIRSKALPGNVITYIKVKDSLRKEAKAGESAIIGYVDGSMKAGDLVYKIIDRKLMEKAAGSYEGKSGTAEKSSRKADITLHFTAGLVKGIDLCAADDAGNMVSKRIADVVEKAANRPLTAETVSVQLEKTGGTPFKIKDSSIELEEGISVPLSKINELRRLVLDELEIKRRNAFKRRLAIDWKIIDRELRKGEQAGRNPEQTNRYIETASHNSKSDSDKGRGQLHYYFWDRQMALRYVSELATARGKKATAAPPARIYLPYNQALDNDLNKAHKIVPVIPNITRGSQDEFIRKNFDKIVEASAEHGIAVGNLGWIKPFISAGITVFGDYGLNLYNSKDFMAVQELGLTEAVVSHEASLEEIMAMDFHGVIPEMAIGGRIPVMTSEHCFIGDYCSCGSKTSYYLEDRKGAQFQIYHEPGTCRNILFGHKLWDNSEIVERLGALGRINYRIYIL